MAHYPTSASQRKALTSLGLAFDVNDSYDSAAAKLDTAGVDCSGQVNGITPREAKKISDTDYAVLLRRAAADAAAYRTSDARSVDQF